MIPARGGSKRVPRKNLRLINGKPLIAYTIEAAQQAKSLTTWVLSTEDEEIADVASSLGARVLKRPDDLATDATTSGAVVRHALDCLEDEEPQFDIVALLHPTSPIRDPQHIDAAVAVLWAFPHNHLLASINPAGKYNASIYMMKRDWFIKHNVHKGDPFIKLEMSWAQSVDINTEADLEVAQRYLNEEC